MQTTVLFSALLFLLPFGTSDDSFHDIVKREEKEHHWNYEEDAGPEKWSTYFPNCAKEKQSPINIETAEVDFNEELEPFEFDNYDDELKDAKIKNNGHTIEISKGEKDAPRTIDEGGMDDKYVFEQAHFHWGSDSKKGSEHTIDGKQFPLELHLVHRNENYNKGKALKKEDGFAVLAVLFKVASEDNEDLEPIIDKLDDVRHENTEADMDDFTLESLLPDNTMPYYRYEGSFTTPPCNEVVTWIIFKEFVPISERQLQQFRNLKEVDPKEAEETLVNNFRPTQPLNARVVEISGTSSASTLVASLVTILALLSFLL